LKTLVVNYDAELKKVSKILGKEVVEKMKHEKPSKFKDKAAWHDASTAYYKHEHRVKYVRALINMATYQKKVDAEAARRISETAERGRGMTKHKRITLKRILEGEKQKSQILVGVKVTDCAKDVINKALRRRKALKEAPKAKVLKKKVLARLRRDLRVC